LDRSHVQAFTVDGSDNVAVVPFEWAGDSSVVVTPAVPIGTTLVVYRDTPKDKPLANFSDGAVISEANLDRNAAQAVFIAAEALDRGEGALNEFSSRAVTVPVGEVAPTLPRRDALKGKLIGVDTNGNFIGVNLGGGGPGGPTLPISTDDVEFQGSPLTDNLHAQLELIGLNAANLDNLVQVVTEQGTSWSWLDGKLDQLAADHEDLSGALDALADLRENADGALQTLIVDETSARTAGDSALAAKLAILGAASVDGTAFVLDLDNVKVSPDESLADRFTMLAATGEGGPDGEALAALITDERNARIAGDNAAATARTALGATLRGEIDAAVLSEKTARISADEAEASARTALATTLNGNISSAISSEATTRANADTALANTVALLGAKNGGSTAFVLNTSTTQIGGGTSLAAKFTALDTAIGNASAAIASEQSARISAITAEASARTALATTLNGNISSAISSEATTRANADTAISANVTSLSTTVGGHTSTLTSHASTIGGLNAKYGVSLNVNGHITGFSQNNNGTTGNFVVVADKFGVAAPGGGTATYPFEIVSGVTYIKSAVIRAAAITSAHIANLSVDTAKIANLAVGTTKITENAASKYTYADFTRVNLSLNQEIDIATLVYAKDVATSYLRIDFGGNLLLHPGNTLEVRIMVNGSQRWSTSINSPSASDFYSVQRYLHTISGSLSGNVTVAVRAKLVAGPSCWIEGMRLEVSEIKR